MLTKKKPKTENEDDANFFALPGIQDSKLFKYEIRKNFRDLWKSTYMNMAKFFCESSMNFQIFEIFTEKILMTSG